MRVNARCLEAIAPAAYSTILPPLPNNCPQFHLNLLHLCQVDMATKAWCAEHMNTVQQHATPGDIPNTILQRTHSTTQCDCSDWYLGCKCKVTDQQPTLYHAYNQTSQHAVAQHCSAALGENTLHSLLQSPMTMALARGTRCIRHHRMYHIDTVSLMVSWPPRPLHPNPLP